MSGLDDKQQMEYLYDKIKRYLYHLNVLDEMIVDELVYSNLVSELRQLEEKYPEYKIENSPLDNDKLYSKPYLFETVKLKNTVRECGIVESSTVEDLIKEHREYTGTETVYYVESYPIGVDLELEYVYGNLYRAYMITENVGEDVTDHMKHIYDIPKYIPQMKKVENVKVKCVVYLENPSEDLDTNYIRRVVRTVSNNFGNTDIIRSFAQSICSSSRSLAEDRRKEKKRLESLGFVLQKDQIFSKDMKKIKKFVEEHSKGKIILNSYSERAVLEDNNCNWEYMWGEKA